MTPGYKDAITAAMTAIGADPLARFVGYGVRYGRAAGTLADIAEPQLVETTVAENLMAGLATGMALTGLRPVVFFERFDFVLNAADAIVNHLDKVGRISRGEFSAGVILRVVVGNMAKPLFTGETHTQCFARPFSEMLEMPVVQLTRAEAIGDVYRSAHDAMARGESTMVVEYKDLY